MKVKLYRDALFREHLVIKLGNLYLVARGGENPWAQLFTKKKRALDGLRKKKKE